VVALVTGPVRAGKSSFALELARATGKTPLYLATAAFDPADPEMAERVARHRTDRAGMRTIEIREPAGPRLIDTLRHVQAGEVAILDSVGSWFGALLLGEEANAETNPLGVGARLAAAAAALQETLSALAGDAIVVAEETGWGVVPVSPLGRIFRDELGRASAGLARRADQAHLVVAGYALDLRALGRPVSD
jgi:adenosylcobinamide kinase/adenosylcobinamide-phosphate guanylyltransferase